MQTISFYAYKGGTGRSLVLANAAKYLARLGQTVFALDLDLEAPGLHYKLALLHQATRLTVTKGVVDYVDAFIDSGRLPDSLAPFVVNASATDDSQGKIWLMPAGNVMASSYWKNLAKINWHGLFYEDKPQGIPLFLELKERILKEYSPDFLLIDARTGITETGGIATTILPDQVVCLFLNNRENLDGTRQVLRSMVNSTRLPGQDLLHIVPVLSRVPVSRVGRLSGRVQQTNSGRVASEVTDYLREDDVVAELLDHEPVLVLRSEESLQIAESLRIGGATSVDESPLLRDYLRLFSRLIPRDAVKPHLRKLIDTSLRQMMDNPDATQANLEALAEYCPHPDSYLALLKLYRVRNAEPIKLLRTAARLWELDRDASDPLLWEIIQSCVGYLRMQRRNQDSVLLADFADAIWREAGAFDPQVGLALADFCLESLNDPDRAVEVISTILQHSDVDQQVVGECLKRLATVGHWSLASDVIDKYKVQFSDDAKFQAAWADVVVKQNDVAKARSFLDNKAFRPAKLLSSHPATYARLLRLAGQTEELEATLENALDQELGRRSSSASPASSALMEIAQFYFELGKKEVFEKRVRDVLPSRQAERVLRHTLLFDH